MTCIDCKQKVGCGQPLMTVMMCVMLDDKNQLRLTRGGNEPDDDTADHNGAGVLVNVMLCMRVATTLKMTLAMAMVVTMVRPLLGTRTVSR